MSFSWLLVTTTPRQLRRLVPARIVAVPSTSIFPQIRSFASTPSSKKSRETKKPKEEDVVEDEAPEHLPTEVPGRRIIDNNNPQPAISLPGGLSWPFSSSSATDAALTTLVGLGLVFLGGVGYLAWYKKRVLDKMEQAFAKGYDPALELAGHVHPVADTHDALSYAESEHLTRREQKRVDAIVGGHETGHYFLLMGPKGTGKSTMILEAMRAIEAEGVSICEAHPDLEVFRLRLGKSLNFEYNEDTQTGLFQRRDPREGGPALDIERAFNKLEKVALRCHKKNGKPLVLIFNNVHLFPNNEEGQNMLLQIQQRAEAWGESGIMTIVFTSDDFWPYLTLRKNHNRMQVVSVADLDANASAYALRKMRSRLPSREGDTPEVLSEALSVVGGRLAFLSKISRAKDMAETAKQMLIEEKMWLLSQIGLIKDCDDDVMDEQKWSSCSWLLLQEFVKMRQEQEKEMQERLANGEITPNEAALPLPVIPYHKCRSIMTRTDFIEDLDRHNIISIDIHLGVRPDSMLILTAAREVVEEEGFEDLLQSVRDRIDEIESLHRTAEVTFKDFDKEDLVRVVLGKRGRKEQETSWPT